MNYIIFDLEATCEKDDYSFVKEIIEIGAVKVSSEFEVIDTFQSFVRPVVNPILTDFCKELTEIRQNDVDQAPLFPQAIASFKNWVQEDDYILLSWGDFDRNQLRKDSSLHKLSHNWITFKHDNLKARHAKYVLGTDRGVGMKSALKIANLSLEGSHHRAIDDAKNIVGIFLKYRDDLALSELIQC